MTLKQFFMVGGGLTIAFLINATKVVFLIRYPLMAIFAGGGAVLAFVPIGGRPAATWLVAFIKSIYSPTIYTYKKGGAQNWMEWQAKEETEEMEAQLKPIEDIKIKVKKGNRVKNFIHSLPTSRKSKIKDKSVVEKKVGVEEDKTEIQLRGMLMEKKKKREKENEAGVVEDWREKQVSLGLKREKLGATGEAVFGSIPMPSIPEVSNLIVGMVTNPEGKIVEDAIVEIQDGQGHPVRVLKTNSLGQFKTSTQLANGKYLVITEKKGQDFDRVNIELGGRIVEPIKIQAIA